MAVLDRCQCSCAHASVGVLHLLILSESLLFHSRALIADQSLKARPILRTVTLGSKCSTVSQDSGIASGIAPFSHSQMIYHDVRVQTSGSTTFNRSYRVRMKNLGSGRGLYLMSDGKVAEGYRASVDGCRQKQQVCSLR